MLLHKMQAEDIIQYDTYLSGPMSGYEDYNFPAFNKAAKELREQGEAVFNPAESFDGEKGHDWETYLRYDTMAVAQSKKILMLPGWRESRGACFEYLIAKTLGLEIEKLKSSDTGRNEDGNSHRVALLGYARTGKDTVGIMLIEQQGFDRVAVGDYIKSQLDPVIQAHLGHSAFTEDDELKENIRETLVHFGYANYENILDEFMEHIPKKAVNTRLYRFKEAIKWKGLKGSELWLISRPGYGPKEPKVKEELDQIIDAGMIDRVIHNDQCKEALQHKVNHNLQAMVGV